MNSISELTRNYEAKATHALEQENRFRATAAAEGRALGPGEVAGINMARQEANRCKAELTAAQNRIDRQTHDAGMTAAVERLEAQMMSSSSSRTGSSIGQQIIDSEMGRFLLERKGRFPSGAWTSPSSEIFAATLTEDSASGGALVIPDHRPGILPLPTRPLVMSDLIAPGTTDSNVVTYMRELAFTNAADTVAEGIAKPESTLTFEAVSDPVRKIATWIPVTEEMLEDTPGLRSYLDTRLSLGVQLAEDDQLISGSVVAPDVIGFLNRTGLAAAVARGTDTNADAIVKQIAAIFTATGLQPTGLVLNPANWLAIQLVKTAAGEYISGGTPFQTPPTPNLWGLPVALTSAMPAGTALVGAFKTASQIFRKGGLRVEASNSHASFFVENKIAIRAEERIALAVYRPSAFGIVTGLTS